jgi:hypothetical protein
MVCVCYLISYLFQELVQRTQKFTILNCNQNYKYQKNLFFKIIFRRFKFKEAETKLKIFK